ncbi:MAG: tRNA uridine-5-carboxymethylaminomethyl(34) synthesis GTPase MnmE [Rhizobiaceae bacterium]
MGQTIFALSSGSLPSGVAIIRLSGPDAFASAEAMAGVLPEPRVAKLTSLFDPSSKSRLDDSLLLVFPGPNSFTGEDVVEFHCHGGIATVASVLSTLATMPGCRPAEAGEFSRRAFENGKLDLTSLEGLSDLIAAQTEQQRRQALSQSGGQLRELYEGWRRDLIRLRALIEAELDFSDEEDVPGSVSDSVWSDTQQLKKTIATHLNDNRRGELIRDGFRIALLGSPNAGKSSLLNALAKRDVAIVTPQAGTTRDVIDVTLDINGNLVVISDTAGFRETTDIVELEGIKRARQTADRADLTLWLQPSDEKEHLPENQHAVVIGTKSDLAVNTTKYPININTTQPQGLDSLLTYINTQLSTQLHRDEEPVATRQRHRSHLLETVDSLNNSLRDNLNIELRSEQLRLASDSLGRITGRIDVEDLLDVIFSEFCIGK